MPKHTMPKIPCYVPRSVSTYHQEALVRLEGEQTVINENYKSIVILLKDAGVQLETITEVSKLIAQTRILTTSHSEITKGLIGYDRSSIAEIKSLKAELRSRTTESQKLALRVTELELQNAALAATISRNTENVSK